MAAQGSRRRARGPQPGLGQDGARAAHGVVQGALAVPLGHGQHGRRHRLLHGGVHGLLAVAPLVERAAGQVDAHGDPVVVGVDAEPEVGVLGVDVRALAGVGAEAVADGVLGAQAGEAAVLQLAVGHVGEHGEGLARAQELAPVHLVDLAVEVVGVVALETQQRGDHPLQQLGGVDQLVDGARVGPEAHAAHLGRDVDRAEGASSRPPPAPRPRPGPGRSSGGLPGSGRCPTWAPLVWQMQKRPQDGGRFQSKKLVPRADRPGRPRRCRARAKGRWRRGPEPLGRQPSRERRSRHRFSGSSGPRAPQAGASSAISRRRRAGPRTVHRGPRSSPSPGPPGPPAPPASRPPRPRARWCRRRRWR